MLLLSLVLSVGFSIKHRSMLFYGVFAVTLFFSIFFAFRSLKPVQVAKPSVRGFILLLIAVIVVLVFPNILPHFWE